MILWTGSHKSAFPVWEMYLGCSLLNRGFTLKSRKDLGKAGPDLCVSENGTRIWIEAVTITAGTGPDAIASLSDRENDTFHPVPEEKIVLRFCSAIRDKYCIYLRHLATGIVRPDEPFLIAISGAGPGVPIEYWAAGPEIPYAIQAVLPIGQYTVTLDRRTHKVVREGHAHRAYIIKLSGSMVPTNSFLDCTFSLISGLLFSNTHLIFSNELRLGKLALLHNSEPLHPINEGWFGAELEWKLRKDKQNDNYVLQLPTRP